MMHFKNAREIYNNWCSTSTEDGIGSLTWKELKALGLNYEDCHFACTVKGPGSPGYGGPHAEARIVNNLAEISAERPLTAKERDEYERAANTLQDTWDRHWQHDCEREAEYLASNQPDEEDVFCENPDGPFYYVGRCIADNRQELDTWMTQCNFWPDVWFISDHGNPHRITQNE